MTASQTLAAFAAGLKYEDIPAPVIERARACIADTIAACTFGAQLPWSRIVIVFFAAAVLVGMWLLLTRTRLGLFVRGVTQNRRMAACVGVNTARVDTLAFALGSGIARTIRGRRCPGRGRHGRCLRC